jgi:3'-5' exoribonuclease
MEKWVESLDELRVANSAVKNQQLLRLNYFTVLGNCAFQQAPGGFTKHHDYQHGLVIHVNEVMQNVRKMCIGRSSDALITAVIWHDFMKIKEYSWDGEKVVKLPYRTLIRHLAGSAMEFHHAACGILVPSELEIIEHLLLSHHGKREWGSPIEPATAEAFILHAADMMSASGCNL